LTGPHNVLRQLQVIKLFVSVANARLGIRIESIRSHLELVDVVELTQPIVYVEWVSWTHQRDSSRLTSRRFMRPVAYRRTTTWTQPYPYSTLARLSKETNDKAVLSMRII
jgi:hypothetical protein